MSRRWATEEVPVINKTFGDRWSSHAVAKAIGVVDRLVDTSSSHLVATL
jgi:hypothetical protein